MTDFGDIEQKEEELATECIDDKNTKMKKIIEKTSDTHRWSGTWVKFINTYGFSKSLFSRYDTE